jgi:hypothetical protein
MLVIKAPLRQAAGPAAAFFAGSFIFAMSAFGFAYETWHTRDHDGFYAMVGMAVLMAGIGGWLLREALNRSPTLIADENGVQLFTSTGPPETIPWSEIVELQKTCEPAGSAFATNVDLDDRPPALYFHLCFIRRGPKPYPARIAAYDLGLPIAVIMRELTMIPEASHVLVVEAVPVNADV